MTVVINGTTGIDTGTGSLIAADSTTPTYLDLFEDTDNGSNYVRLIAPTSVASNKTITLPDATGTMVVGSAAVSAVGQIPFSTDGSSYTPTAKIVSGTSQTAPFASPNTSCDFTGIPSWVKRITVMFSGVSLSGTSNLLIQIGSGSVTTSGYVGSMARGTSYLYNSTGFQVGGGVAAQTYSGIATLSLVGSNVWCQSATIGSNSSDGCYVSGSTSSALSGALDRVRITTVNGTDTFDAGTINILYE